MKDVTLRILLAISMTLNVLFIALNGYGWYLIEQEEVLYDELVELENTCIDYCLAIDAYDYEYVYENSVCGCYDEDYNLLDYYRD